ncbi:MAG: hypothetical protein LUG45_05410 [Clostridiales bacterium]|nr:hypothetical protein [Clostridiales bacterium]
MKRYHIDVRALSSEEKEAVFHQVELLSFLVERVREDNVDVAYIVYWQHPDDFMESSSCPKNCLVRPLQSS